MSMANQFGLLVKGATPIPLKDVAVRAEIQGYVLGLNSTLKYTNDSSDPVEVTFRFPLEDSHAVVGLTAVMGGRNIKAEIREKEEALTAYDDAIASGQSAALGEEKAGDIFSISLGNLAPGKDAEIHLDLVGELPIDAEGKVRFSLPSTLKPRYTPAGSSDPLASFSGAPNSQVELSSAPGVRDFELTILNATQQVLDVTSPTHSLTSIKDSDANKMIISLLEEKSLDKDLVILIEHKNAHEPTVLVEEGKKGCDGYMGYPAVMLNFFPDFDQITEAACEFIFLVDRSGSMSGSYIQSARETLMLFMKSLPESCRFNILGFGSQYKWLFQDVSVQYSQTTLDKAMAHLQHLQADLGGTQLLPLLQDIYSKRLSPGFSRQIFVLTDGSVSNTQDCIKKVKENSHSTRCFTFGIGSGASTSLVEGLAKAGNGAPEFIKEGERMQPKVIRSLKRALQPSVTDVCVDFQLNEKFDVLQSPLILPPIYNREKLVVYGLIKQHDDSLSSNEPLSSTAILRGHIHGKEISHSLPFTINNTQSGTHPSTIVHHLAAKALVKDWQDEKKSENDIIKLSIEGSIISAHTAFIAIDDESSDCISAPMKTWDIQTVQFQSIERQSHLCSTSLACNIDQVLCRSEKLEDLQSQSDALSSQSHIFAKSARPKKGGFSFGSLFSGIFTRDKSNKSSSSQFNSQAKKATVSEIAVTEGEHDFEDDLESDSRLFSSAQCRIDDGLDISPSLSKEVQMKQPSCSITTPSEVLSSIIRAQQANGSWQLDSSLAQFLNKTTKELQDGCPIAVKGGMASVWATIIILSLLKKRYSSQQEEWELIALKGESWLTKQSLPEGVSRDGLFAAADTLL